MSDAITVNGQTYDADEIYERKILVKGAEPTNYEEYQWVNVMVDHRNRKSDAIGVAQSVYKYGTATDLSKFDEHELPYYLNTKMTTVTDKKGEQLQIILWADFANVQEMNLVPRKADFKAPAAKV